jgi:hypothetical protein
MLAQEIFDTVVNHLRKQGRRALGSDNTCLYRAPNGDRCAAGCLVRDEEYQPWMEVRSIVSILEDTKSPSSLKNRLLEHKSLIASLQNIHDAYPVELWENDFVFIAECHKLIYTPTNG